MNHEQDAPRGCGRLRHNNRRGNPHSAPRCGARNRRGSPCQAPAMRGRTRCRLHGGKSTGPTTLEGLTRLRAPRTTGRFSAEGRALETGARAPGCGPEGLERCRRARWIHGARSRAVRKLLKANRQRWRTLFGRSWRNTRGRYGASVPHARRSGEMPAGSATAGRRFLLYRRDRNSSVGNPIPKGAQSAGPVSSFTASSLFCNNLRLSVIGMLLATTCTRQGCNR